MPPHYPLSQILLVELYQSVFYTFSTEIEVENHASNAAETQWVLVDVIQPGWTCELNCGPLIYH